jgi:hypothetical protein
MASVRRFSQMWLSARGHFCLAFGVILCIAGCQPAGPSDHPNPHQHIEKSPNVVSEPYSNVARSTAPAGQEGAKDNDCPSSETQDVGSSDSASRRRARREERVAERWFVNIVGIDLKTRWIIYSPNVVSISRKDPLKCGTSVCDWLFCPAHVVRPVSVGWSVEYLEPGPLKLQRLRVQVELEDQGEKSAGVGEMALPHGYCLIWLPDDKDPRYVFVCSTVSLAGP